MRSLSKKLRKFADILEKISSPKSFEKIASNKSPQEIFNYAKKFSVNMCPSKYLGSESSRLKLKTAASNKIGTIIQELSTGYSKYGDQSAEGISIGEIIPKTGSYQIHAMNKHGHNLSFNLSQAGNQYEMFPIDPTWGKILWKCRVSSSGHIADVLKQWSQEVRVLNFENLYSGMSSYDLGVKLGLRTANYKKSPILTDIQAQQDFGSLVETPADTIFPQDPKWLVRANLKQLKLAWKKALHIKKASPNHESTQKWAEDWIGRIKKEIQQKVKKAKISKKNLIRVKIKELKSLIADLKKESI